MVANVSNELCNLMAVYKLPGLIKWTEYFMSSYTKVTFFIAVN
jgi:hypothetical protein